METLARWTPTTPEMEAKILFGRHIWDFAQHADRLGKRTFELRQSEHYTLRPTEAYQALLDEMAGCESTQARLAAFYDGVLPGLMGRYQAYLGETDPILDGPTVAILEPMVRDVERMRREAAELQREARLLAGSPSLAAREQAIGSIVVQGA
jgi:hypothetical protein